MKKILYIITMLLITGCAQTKINEETVNSEIIITYIEALSILQEETIAEVLDINTGITYNIKRVTGGYNTLADVETLTKEDTEKLLETIDGEWSIQRRAVIITINDIQIPASISPFPHSGSEEYPYGTVVDNRSGSTGTGINLDSIRNNDMIGVVDIFFYNSLTPGLNRIDERHQEKVLEAAAYES